MKRFMLGAALWLPLAFVAWFSCAPVLVWPVVQLAKAVLLHAWPTLFTAVAQGADLLDAQGRVLAHPGYLMQLTTGVLVNASAPGVPARFGFLEPVINPLVYGYSLPLLAGLVLATPLAPRERLAQLALGVPLLWLAQAFGAVAESLKAVAIDAGGAGADAAQRAGLSLNAVALCYQFGYLILPALLPAAIWIVANRSFIERLTGRGRAEPATIGGVSEGTSESSSRR